MTSSKSFELPPRTEGFLTLFVKSQLLTKAKPMPENLDLSGRVAIVTGATAGLGTEASRQLLSLRLSHLIIAVRSVQKGEVLAAKFRSEFPAATLEVWPLEMTSYDSVQKFARRADAELTRLDIAILNAALVNMRFRRVESTGHEEVIQVNYLSTMLLAILLLPVLKAKSPASTPGRLTIVGSGTAVTARLPNRNQVPFLRSFDDTKLQKYDISERYGSSKVLGHLFLAKLAEYVKADDVIVNIVDPGLTKGTRLLRDIGILETLFGMVKALTARTVEVAASTYIDAAVVRGDESHGCFLMDWEIRPFSAIIYTPEGKKLRDRLWDETMKEFAFADARGILERL